MCLECGANDLHIVQLMPLPPIISCFIEIQIGLTLIVPTYPSCPGKESIKRVSVCFSLLLLESPQSRPHWFPSPCPASPCVQCEHAHLYHSASAPGWLTMPTLTTPTVTGQSASPSPTTLWFYNSIDVCVCVIANISSAEVNVWRCYWAACIAAGTWVLFSWCCAVRRAQVCRVRRTQVAGQTAVACDWLRPDSVLPQGTAGMSSDSAVSLKDSYWN